MDLANFERDLVRTLGRPKEWRLLGEECLIHAPSGIKICADGRTYRPLSPLSAFYEICTAPPDVTAICWSKVRKRQASAKAKNSARARKAFLDSFPGFRK